MIAPSLSSEETVRNGKTYQNVIVPLIDGDLNRFARTTENMAIGRDVPGRWQLELSAK
jgi:hypothetical protein